MTAEDLGKRLLADVDQVGLDEILNSLRLDDRSTTSYFNLAALDNLVQIAVEVKAATTRSQPMAPILELMSTSPGSGKTHLLYHLTTQAVLPISLGGRQACVMIIDADGKFLVKRLVQEIAQVAKSHAKDPQSRQELNDIIETSLKHVHIFSPQSMASTIATIQSLPSYLFNANRHHSFDRAVAFIALDSASAFYWQAKSDAEHAFLENQQSPPPSGYIQLADALKNASRIFNATVIFTCWNISSPKKGSSFGLETRAYRSPLPPPWQTLPTLRLLIQRVSVRKLPVEIGVEEALRESEMRQKVVEQGKFECFVNESGLDEWTMQKFQSKSAGFAFRILIDGAHFGGDDVKVG